MALIKPYSEQAERSILGSMLLSNEKVSHCISTLTLDDFFLENNKIIFKVMCELKEQNMPIDLTAVTSKLQTLGRLEEVGGVEELVKLTEVVVTDNVSYYIDILKNKTNLRRLAYFLEKAYDEFNIKSTENINNYLDDFENQVLDITRTRNVSDFINMSKLISDYGEKLANQTLKKRGVTTGYAQLDGILNGGFQKGNLIILAARPGMGKTALALNFAINAAKDSKTPVAFFSLEMGADELMYRMISMTGRIDSKKVQNGEFYKNEDLIRLEGATSKLNNLPIYFDDTPNVQLSDFIAKVRKLKGEIPSLGLVFVDYLQIITTAVEKGSSRERVVAKVATELKLLARDLQIPIVALAQLSRSTEKTKTGEKAKDKRPDLADLRESGQIEQDADIVMFIYKESYYVNSSTEEKPETEDVEVIVKKNRNGATGTVELIATTNCYRYDGKKAYENSQNKEN